MVFIKGEDIYLRGLTEEDVDGPWLDWFNDAEVCRFNNHHRFPSNGAALQDYLSSVTNSKKALFLGIFSTFGDTHLGNISLQNIDWINRSAEFAIIIGAKDSWKKGVGYEAGRLIIDHGLRELNLHRIFCGTSADNLGMQKLALKLGMSEEGRRRDSMFKNGQYVDIIEYGLVMQE